jgi:hypothetical protein
MTIYCINLPQRSFEHALDLSGGEMATSRTTYVLKIRHFSIVKLTNSSYDASREDGRIAPARTLLRYTEFNGTVGRKSLTRKTEPQVAKTRPWSTRATGTTQHVPPLKAAGISAGS